MFHAIDRRSSHTLDIIDGKEKNTGDNVEKRCNGGVFISPREGQNERSQIEIGQIFDPMLILDRINRLQCESLRCIVGLSFSPTNVGVITDAADAGHNGGVRFSGLVERKFVSSPGLLRGEPVPSDGQVFQRY